MKISYEFPVIYLDGDDPEHGEAKIVYEKACIRPLQLHRDPYEVLLEARGYSFHIIFGSQINGNFLCIPNWNVGCELAELWDRSWNMDSILRAGNQLDALIFSGKIIGVVMPEKGADDIALFHPAFKLAVIRIWRARAFVYIALVNIIFVCNIIFSLVAAVAAHCAFCALRHFGQHIINLRHNDVLE